MDAIVVKDYRQNRIHPQKFALWVACASMVMMFAAFTSAYIVRQAAGNWLEFQLPDIFMLNTGVILLSSLTLQYAFINFKKGNTTLYRGLLVITFLLGCLFIGLQYQGWLAMEAIGVGLTVNPSSSFVYLISGVHAAHLLGGIAALLIAMIHAFVLPHQVTPGRKLRFELTLTYWHFVDLLWVYLLAFFLLSA